MNIYCICPLAKHYLWWYRRNIILSVVSIKFWWYEDICHAVRPVWNHGFKTSSSDITEIWATTKDYSIKNEAAKRYRTLVLLAVILVNVIETCPNKMYIPSKAKGQHQRANNFSFKHSYWGREIYSTTWTWNSRVVGT